MAAPIALQAANEDEAFVLANTVKLNPRFSTKLNWSAPLGRTVDLLNLMGVADHTLRPG
jgi:hypothetical protein